MATATKTKSKRTKRTSSRKTAGRSSRSTKANASSQRATGGKKRGGSGQSARNKWVYSFDQKKTEGTRDMKALLGGKGANLAEMTSIGLPVPPGFTISTDACAEYYNNGRKFPPGLEDQIAKAVDRMERMAGRKLGDPDHPLLVSVRSGAAISMPGMMDTILNLGLNDASVAGLTNATGNERFAYDAYRRLIDMFGDVVMGVDRQEFEEAFDKVKLDYRAETDTDVPTEGLVQLVEQYKKIFRKHTGEPFPQDPMRQLRYAIEAVFGSWMTPRAVRYREVEEIKGLLGTAVNVQAMAFGNMGDNSGTGVAFTRDPSTGKNEFYGEFLVNAQGEDVVAGIRTPKPIQDLKKWNRSVWNQLLDIKKKLEGHYRDMQDIEFTVEDGKLYMLQTRTGKRTGVAAVKVACDMVREKRLTEKEAVLRVPPEGLNQLLLPSFDPAAQRDVLTVGLPASPGAAVGKPAFTAEEAVERAHAGEKVLLVRKETSPEDIDGMHSAVGILTSTGGMTSHAAVVARGWGKCCVAGAGQLTIDPKKKSVSVDGRKFGKNDVISLDGTTGEVMAGAVPTRDAQLSGDFRKLMRWADKHRTMRVRTNADTPRDAQRAREFGAQGIGLCRTEHMFFEGDRITAMRRMILSDNEHDRRAALDKLRPYQREDFEGIFEAMKNLPVTIRLLDPPLHEFLPNEPKQQNELAHELGMKPAKVKNRIAQLHEMNPMLGHRGCRLSITYPEILEMQVRAITEAAIECKRSRITVRPEIMIPLVGEARELETLRQRTDETIRQVKKDAGYSGKLNISIGTMIEVPRAALTAERIGAHADFFSFGTNDLTQMTFGYSRDDSGAFLPHYLEREVLESDPFRSLDRDGVGQLVRMGCEGGRKANAKMKLGICGEHGGDPSSIGFCNDAGLDYVSCSPFRVPIARLAAAQAALSDGG